MRRHEVGRGAGGRSTARVQSAIVSRPQTTVIIVVAVVAAATTTNTTTIAAVIGGQPADEPSVKHIHKNDDSFQPDTERP